MHTMIVRVWCSLDFILPNLHSLCQGFIETIPEDEKSRVGIDSGPPKPFATKVVMFYVIKNQVLTLSTRPRNPISFKPLLISSWRPKFYLPLNIPTSSSSCVPPRPRTAGFPCFPPGGELFHPWPHDLVSNQRIFIKEPVPANPSHDEPHRSTTCRSQDLAAHSHFPIH